MNHDSKCGCPDCYSRNCGVETQQWVNVGAYIVHSLSSGDLVISIAGQHLNVSPSLVWVPSEEPKLKDAAILLRMAAHKLRNSVLRHPEHAYEPDAEFSAEIVRWLQRNELAGDAALREKP
jgi:hypothetical protein